MFRIRSAKSRRGTTTVEAAIVLPVFITFVFAIVEFGHTQMVNNLLNSACRNAARLGAVEGTTTADVENKVREILGSGVNAAAVDIFVKDASAGDGAGGLPETGQGIESLSDLEVADAEPRQLFVVRATVPYNNVALLPNSLMKNVTLQSQSFMRHE